MNTITPAQLIQQLIWRYATKQFDPGRKMSPDVWAALEDSLVLSPSSYGLQPWKFINVTNADIRAKLRKVSWNQSQVTDSSHFVVFAVKTNLGGNDVDEYVKRTAEVRGVSLESLEGFRKMLLDNIINGMDDIARKAWATRQVYIALGTFLASAAILGIDACPMEGFDPGEYNKLLGLTNEGLSAVVVAAAGYRSPADKYGNLPKVRFAKETVLREI